MEISACQDLAWLDSPEALAQSDFANVLQTVRLGELSQLKFGDALENALAQRQDSYAADPVKACKVAMAFYALSCCDDALLWLDRAGDGITQSCLRGDCLRELKRYDEAVAAFEDAEGKGWDGFLAAMNVVDCLRRAGDFETAFERLKRVSRVGDIRAEYHFQLGRLYDVSGDHEMAFDEYHRAIELDPHHSHALFHLAYAYDLYGDEKEAVVYYERCVEDGAPFVSALMNLVVIYEELGEYPKAEFCVRRVLDAYPNHKRAQMFLKDIQASTTMYIDEDRERMIDRRNQVLEIPISDFELSVRSRNCLKKMNIRTIGDLLNVTEQDLLAYKNFGETSLLEIKAILAQKGLRLGQMLEERGNNMGNSSNGGKRDDGKDEVLRTPISELDLSVRARKCLQRLNINHVGELCDRTEAELLGCKNFGMTSLLEIKQRLKERSLSLRQLED